MKKCKCGREAIEGPFCDVCNQKIKDQIDREIQQDEIAVKANDALDYFMDNIRL